MLIYHNIYIMYLSRHLKIKGWYKLYDLFFLRMDICRPVLPLFVRTPNLVSLCLIISRTTHTCNVVWEIKSFHYTYLYFWIWASKVVFFRFSFQYWRFRYLYYMINRCCPIAVIKNNVNIYILYYMRFIYYLYLSKIRNYDKSKERKLWKKLLKTKLILYFTT